MSRTPHRARPTPEGLAMYAIYQRPTDYPDSFVVRRYRILAGRPEPVPDPDPWAICPTLHAAREAVPVDACIRLVRHPTDLASLVETWT